MADAGRIEEAGFEDGQQSKGLLDKDLNGLSEGSFR